MKFSGLLTLLATSIFLSSCSKTPPASPTPPAIQTPAAKVNPHPPGTYDHFKFANYPGTTNTWRNSTLLAQASPSNTKIRVSLSSQRGFLLVNDQIAMDFRVSSGKSTHPTPTGEFKITEKLKDKKSNLYGKVYNSSGGVVNSSADSRKASVPAGGKFVGASMPYWMRLTGSGVGLHQGIVTRRYASHGCIRVHSSAASTVFSKVKVGTPVSVQ